jgi:hypothetical protein
MKTRNLFGKMSMIVAVAILGNLSSCKKDDETVTGQDVVDASSESVVDANYDDADDLSTSYVQNATLTGGRVATDNRLSCATVHFTDGSTKTLGGVVIDFGTGCTDAKGNVRKGKINLTYSGNVGLVGFTLIETFDGYSINSVVLNGTRTLVREEATGNAIKHHITLAEGKATWPDNTFATRTSDFHRQFNLADSTITIDGHASGSGRLGKTYDMNITKTLVYKRICMVNNGIYMAVQGTKSFTIDTKSIIIDFGDGSCDRTVEITIGNKSKTFTAGLN